MYILDVIAQAHYLVARHYRRPTREPTFTSDQLEWLAERIPSYMQYDPKSDETRRFIRSTMVEFDVLWPLRLKLWPEYPASTLYTDDMRSAMLAQTSILRANITGHLLWQTQYKLRREKNKTGIKPAKWFWYWGVGQT
ncbi:hypothetical protein C8R48DRAFT_669273 [Suillus tomentosus]|nr:hypothetical protein C8R48DRAFT_669273 [Suillus tomentosus]